MFEDEFRTIPPLLPAHSLPYLPAFRLSFPFSLCPSCLPPAVLSALVPPWIYYVGDSMFFELLHFLAASGRRFTFERMLRDLFS